MKVLAAKSCPTLCDPMDCSPPSRLLCPWNFPGKNTKVGGHSLLRGFSVPRDKIGVFCIAGKFFIV